MKKLNRLVVFWEVYFRLYCPLIQSLGPEAIAAVEVEDVVELMVAASQRQHLVGARAGRLALRLALVRHRAVRALPSSSHFASSGGFTNFFSRNLGRKRLPQWRWKMW